jgi:hypothetical protein
MIDATEYASKLGLGSPILDRVHELCNMWEGICPSPLRSIFISEYVSEDGNKQYESLWIIAEKHAIELPQFVTENDGDIVPLNENVIRVQIERRDFNFDTATAASRLTVIITFTSSLMLTGTFKASGDNCVELHALLKQHLLPNLASTTH